MKKISSEKTCLGIFAGASLIGFMGLTLAVLVVLFVCYGLVQVLDEMTKSIDDQPTGVSFFASRGGWDYQRIALIEPYHAIDTNSNDETWIIESIVESPRYSSSTGATKLNVINNKYIVTYIPNGVLEGKRFDEVWRVIIPDENVEVGFSSEAEFLVYLKDRGIDQPNLTSINKLYEELKEKGYLEWFPEAYKEGLQDSGYRKSPQPSPTCVVVFN